MIQNYISEMYMEARDTMISKNHIGILGGMCSLDLQDGVNCRAKKVIRMRLQEMLFGSISMRAIELLHKQINGGYVTLSVTGQNWCGAFARYHFLL